MSLFLLSFLITSFGFRGRFVNRFVVFPVKSWRRQSHVDDTELFWLKISNVAAVLESRLRNGGRFGKKRTRAKDSTFVILNVWYVLWFLRRSDVMHSDKSVMLLLFRWCLLTRKGCVTFLSLMCTKSPILTDGHLCRMNTSSLHFLVFQLTNKTCSPSINERFQSDITGGFVCQQAERECHNV